MRSAGTGRPTGLYLGARSRNGRSHVSRTIRTSASAYGFRLPLASEPKRRTSRTSGWDAPRARAASRSASRTFSLSRERTLTELNDDLRVRDRLLRFAPRVVLPRRACREPVRVARRKVVLVQRLRQLDQGGRGRAGLRQEGQQLSDIVPPGGAPEGEVQRLAGLLGRLLGCERRPFEVAAARGKLRVVQVRPRLPHPVPLALRHVLNLAESGPCHKRSGGGAQAALAHAWLGYNRWGD